MKKILMLMFIFSLSGCNHPKINITFNNNKNNISFIEINGVKYDYDNLFIDNDYLNSHPKIDIKLY